MIHTHLYCPKCGANNANDAAFCLSCGAPFAASGSPAPSSQPMTSPSLGASQQGSRMDEMKAVLNNAIALVKNPVGYMTQNKDQNVSVNSLMINYVAILALVPLVGRLLG